MRGIYNSLGAMLLALWIVRLKRILELDFQVP